MYIFPVYSDENRRAFCGYSYFYYIKNSLLGNWEGVWVNCCMVFAHQSGNRPIVFLVQHHTLLMLNVKVWYKYGV
jgi:hypothetical protein